MQLVRFLHHVAVACVLLSLAGCSSLGLSCYSSGHSLTKRAAAVVQQSPRRPHVPRELQQAVVPEHFLQPGDVLLIEPVDFDADVRIPADQQVLIDGSIDLGGFGRVVVAGLTLESAEQLIERTIVDAGRDVTRINVRLLDPVDRYYVLGEVNSPGSYPLEGSETVLDGLLAAGGLTSSAAPCKILLARPTLPTSCRITLPVCYREITQLGDTTTNYQLQPGDRIFVAARTWCEELKFWQATSSCAHCGDCQSACLDPSVMGHFNPITPVDSRTSVDSGSFDLLPEPAAGLSASDAIAERASLAEPLPPADVMPPARDGELDFAEGVDSERFEPLWIQSAEQ